MAGGVGWVGSTVVDVVPQRVVLLGIVKLGGLRGVQTLHAASRTVLVRTLPQVTTTRVDATGQVGAGNTGRNNAKLVQVTRNRQA